MLKDVKTFKSDLYEIKKEILEKQSNEQNNLLYNFTDQEKMLLSFIMIILQWCLNHCINQSKEKDLKY